MDKRNETVDDLRDVLIRAGFVRCDIAACNCGSWHHRYGLPERFNDFEQALTEAGHPPCNANGHVVVRALAGLIAERDSLLAALQASIGYEEPSADMKNRPEEYM